MMRSLRVASLLLASACVYANAVAGGSLPSPNLGAATTLNGVAFAPVATSGSASDLTTGTLAAGRLPTIPVGNISGLATSATTDATNASNITSGTLAVGRLPTIPVGNISGLATSATIDATNASNINSGTLAVGRLPTLSSYFDTSTTTQGSILYRSATGWTFLPPGTNGYVIASQGSGANLTWVPQPSPGSGGTLTSVTAGTGLLGGTITNSGSISLAPAGASAIGGVMSATAAAHQFATGISTSGALSFAQPTYGDLSAGAPTATSTVLGLVKPDNTTILSSSGVLSAAPVAASALTGTALASGVTTSSLQTTGTLTSGATGAGFTIDIGASTVSGVQSVANGGTGASSLTGLLKGTGATAFVAAAPGTDYLTPTGSAAGLTGLSSGQVTGALGFTPFSIAATALPAGVVSAPGLGAAPTASSGPTAVPGSALTYLRSDAAPSVNQTANYSWTGTHAFGTTNANYPINASSMGLDPGAVVAVNAYFTGSVWKFQGNGQAFVQNNFATSGFAETYTTAVNSSGAGATATLIGTDKLYADGHRQFLVTPQAPTPSTSDISGDIATTAFVNNFVASAGSAPTALSGPSAVSGSASTYMRSDAAPAINLASAYNWLGAHVFGTAPTSTGAGQATANFNTAGALGGSILLQDTTTTPSAGGAIVLGGNGGYFAAIKGLLTNSATNSTGDIDFETRHSTTDSTLTPDFRILPGAVYDFGTLTITGAAAFNGGATSVTPAPSDNSTNVATTAWVGSGVNLGTPASVTLTNATGYPIATATVAGIVKPDNATITNSAGAISVTYGTAVSTAAQGNDSRITGALQSSATTLPSSFATSSLTSLGTLTGLTVSGSSSLGGVVTLSSATGTAGTANKLAFNSGLYGIGQSPSSFDFASNGAYNFYCSGVRCGDIGPTGLNYTAIGQLTPAAATVTAFTAQTSATIPTPVTTDNSTNAATTAWSCAHDLTVSCYGGSPSATGAANCTAFSNAASSGLAVRIASGNYTITCATPPIIGGANGGGLWSPSPRTVTITNTTANIATLQFANNCSNCFLKGVTLVRVPTATSGGNGVDSGNNCAGCLIENVTSYGNYNGVVLHTTGLATLRDVNSELNVNNGFDVSNTTSLGSAGNSIQWMWENTSAQQNGNIGYAFYSNAVSGTYTVTFQPPLAGLVTFGNKIGISFVGNSTTGLADIELSDSFFGNDTQDEIYINAYGDNSQTNIRNVTTEDCGTNCLEITGNNQYPMISNFQAREPAQGYSGITSAAIGTTVSNPKIVGSSDSGSTRIGVYLSGQYSMVNGGFVTGLGTGVSINGTNSALIYCNTYGNETHARTYVSGTTVQDVGSWAATP